MLHLCCNIICSVIIDIIYVAEINTKVLFECGNSHMHVILMGLVTIKSIITGGAIIKRQVNLYIYQISES